MFYSSQDELGTFGRNGAASADCADFHRDLLVRLCVVGRPGCSSYFESSRWTRIKFSSVGERGVWCLSCCLAAVIVSVVVVYTMLICYLWYWNVATCLNNSEYAYLCGTYKVWDVFIDFLSVIGWHDVFVSFID